MIRISNIKYPIEAPEENLIEFTAKKYNLRGIRDFRIIKKSIDARRKTDIHYVYTIDITAENENTVLKRCRQASRVKLFEYVFRGGRAPKKPVVIAGFGPAGMMCAYMLAKHGCKVIVAERGRDVDSRAEDVERFRRTGVLNTESNVQFGEGGAGTFSDGKLTTGINDERVGYVLKEFALHGAPPEIVYSSKPHIGTDRLRDMVKSFRRDIISMGGEIRFSTLVKDIEVNSGRVTAVILKNGENESRVETDNVIMATGHSARDTFEMLRERGADMERKVFAVGARIEHKQEWISLAQYGELYTMLPAADYKLAVKTQSGRSAYTFCMCPGGEVIASASEAGGVVTNGMSEYARNGENANSALLVNVTPDDLPGTDVLEGIYFQRNIERRAYELCGGYYAPAQTVGDFLDGSGAEPELEPTYMPGVKYVSLDDILPDFITSTMREAILLMDKRLKGFARSGAVLTAPETRSSSPVRVLRDPVRRESNISGLYPCGEGAGYAGGIMTAAVDGIKTAEAVMNGDETDE